MRRFLIFVTFAALLVAGCGGSGSGVDPVNQKFFYRITNAIPDVAGVDFVVQDGATQTTDTNVPFAGSTNYVETDLVDHQIFFDIFETGTSNVIDSITLDKGDEVSQHLFAVGAFGGNSNNDPPIARLFPVNVVRTTPQGNARIVLVHGYVEAAGTQAPSIDLLRDLVPTPIVTNLAFGTSNTFTLPAGTYDFKVRRTGQGAIPPIASLTTNGVLLEANKVYIFLLQGQEGQAGPLAPKINIFEEPIRDP